jgi:hypothetical protein
MNSMYRLLLNNGYKLKKILVFLLINSCLSVHALDVETVKKAFGIGSSTNQVCASTVITTLAAQQIAANGMQSALDYIKPLLDTLCFTLPGDAQAAANRIRQVGSQISVDLGPENNPQDVSVLIESSGPLRFTLKTPVNKPLLFKNINPALAIVDSLFVASGLHLVLQIDNDSSTQKSKGLYITTALRSTNNTLNEYLNPLALTDLNAQFVLPATITSPKDIQVSLTNPNKPSQGYCVGPILAVVTNKLKVPTDITNMLTTVTNQVCMQTDLAFNIIDQDSASIAVTSAIGNLGGAILITKTGGVSLDPSTISVTTALHNHGEGIAGNQNASLDSLGSLFGNLGNLIKLRDTTISFAMKKGSRITVPQATGTTDVNTEELVLSNDGFTLEGAVILDSSQLSSDMDAAKQFIDVVKSLGITGLQFKLNIPLGAQSISDVTFNLSVTNPSGRYCLKPVIEQLIKTFNVPENYVQTAQPLLGLINGVCVGTTIGFKLHQTTQKPYFFIEGSTPDGSLNGEIQFSLGNINADGTPSALKPAVVVAGRLNKDLAFSQLFKGAPDLITLSNATVVLTNAGKNSSSITGAVFGKPAPAQSGVLQALLSADLTFGDPLKSLFGLDKSTINLVLPSTAIPSLAQLSDAAKSVTTQSIADLLASAHVELTDAQKKPLSICLKNIPGVGNSLGNLSDVCVKNINLRIDAVTGSLVFGGDITLNNKTIRTSFKIVNDVQTQSKSVVMMIDATGSSLGIADIDSSLNLPFLSNVSLSNLVIAYAGVPNERVTLMRNNAPVSIDIAQGLTIAGNVSFTNLPQQVQSILTSIGINGLGFRIAKQPGKPVQCNLEPSSEGPALCFEQVVKGLLANNQSAQFVQSAQPLLDKFKGVCLSGGKKPASQEEQAPQELVLSFGGPTDFGEVQLQLALGGNKDANGVSQPMLYALGFKPKSDLTLNDIIPGAPGDLLGIKNGSIVITNAGTDSGRAITGALFGHPAPATSGVTRVLVNADVSFYGQLQKLLGSGFAIDVAIPSNMKAPTDISMNISKAFDGKVANVCLKDFPAIADISKSLGDVCIENFGITTVNNARMLGGDININGIAFKLAIVGGNQISLSVAGTANTPGVPSSIPLSTINSQLKTLDDLFSINDLAFDIILNPTPANEVVGNTFKEMLLQNALPQQVQSGLYAQMTLTSNNSAINTYLDTLSLKTVKGTLFIPRGFTSLSQIKATLTNPNKPANGYCLAPVLTQISNDFNIPQEVRDILTQLTQNICYNTTLDLTMSDAGDPTISVRSNYNDIDGIIQVAKTDGLSTDISTVKLTAAAHIHENAGTTNNFLTGPFASLSQFIKLKEVTIGLTTNDKANITFTRTTGGVSAPETLLLTNGFSLKGSMILDNLPPEMASAQPFVDIVKSLGITGMNAALTIPFTAKTMSDVSFTIDVIKSNQKYCIKPVIEALIKLLNPPANYTQIAQPLINQLDTICFGTQIGINFHPVTKKPYFFVKSETGDIEGQVQFSLGNIDAATKQPSALMPAIAVGGRFTKKIGFAELIPGAPDIIDIANMSVVLTNAGKDSPSINGQLYGNTAPAQSGVLQALLSADIMFGEPLKGLLGTDKANISISADSSTLAQAASSISALLANTKLFGPDSKPLSICLKDVLKNVDLGKFSTLCIKDLTLNYDEASKDVMLGGAIEFTPTKVLRANFKFVKNQLTNTQDIVMYIDATGVNLGIDEIDNTLPGVQFLPEVRNLIIAYTGLPNASIQAIRNNQVQTIALKQGLSISGQIAFDGLPTEVRSLLSSMGIDGLGFSIDKQPNLPARFSFDPSAGGGKPICMDTVIGALVKTVPNMSNNSILNQFAGVCLTAGNKPTSNVQDAQAQAPEELVLTLGGPIAGKGEVLAQIALGKTIGSQGTQTGSNQPVLYAIGFKPSGSLQLSDLIPNMPVDFFSIANAQIVITNAGQNSGRAVTGSLFGNPAPAVSGTLRALVSADVIFKGPLEKLFGKNAGFKVSIEVPSDMGSDLSKIKVNFTRTGTGNAPTKICLGDLIKGIAPDQIAQSLNTTCLKNFGATMVNGQFSMSGQADVFGKAIDLVFQFGTDDAGQKSVVLYLNLQSGQSSKIGDLIPQLKQVDAMLPTLKNLGLAFATSDIDILLPGTNQSKKLSAGLNVVATAAFEGTGIVNDFMKTIDLTELQASVTIPQDLNPMGFKATLAKVLSPNAPKTMGKIINIKEFALTIGGDLSVSFALDSVLNAPALSPSPLGVIFKAKANINAGTVDLIGEVQGSIPSLFGLPLAVADPVVSVGIGGPIGVSSIGLGGKMMFTGADQPFGFIFAGQFNENGDFGVQGATLPDQDFKTVPPAELSQVKIVGNKLMKNGQQLTGGKLCATDLTILAQSVLKKAFDINIPRTFCPFKNLIFNVASKDFQLGSYIFKQGIKFHVELNPDFFFGTNGFAEADISPTGGIIIRGYLDPINIGNGALTITSANDDNKGANLDVALTPSDQRFKISGKVSLANGLFNEAVEISIDKNGFFFEIKGRAFFALNFDLDILFPFDRPENARVKASLQSALTQESVKALKEKLQKAKEDADRALQKAKEDVQKAQDQCNNSINNAKNDCSNKMNDAYNKCTGEIYAARDRCRDKTPSIFRWSCDVTKAGLAGCDVIKKDWACQTLDAAKTVGCGSIDAAKGAIDASQKVADGVLKAVELATEWITNNFNIREASIDVGVRDFVDGKIPTIIIKVTIAGKDYDWILQGVSFNDLGNLIKQKIEEFWGEITSAIEDFLKQKGINLPISLGSAVKKQRIETQQDRDYMLWDAINTGNPTILSLMLQRGANPNSTIGANNRVTNVNGGTVVPWTPLVALASTSNPTPDTFTMVRMLIEHSAFNPVDNNQVAAAISIASANNNMNLINTLNANAQIKSYVQAQLSYQLVIAIASGNQSFAQQVLNTIENPGLYVVVNNESTNAMSMAYALRNGEMMRLLNTKGVSMNDLKSPDNVPAIFIEIGTNNASLVTILLDGGVDPNALAANYTLQDNLVPTPLVAAVAVANQYENNAAQLAQSTMIIERIVKNPKFNASASNDQLKRAYGMATPGIKSLLSRLIPGLEASMVNLTGATTATNKGSSYLLKLKK